MIAKLEYFLLGNVLFVNKSMNYGFTKRKSLVTVMKDVDQKVHNLWHAAVGDRLCAVCIYLMFLP